MPGGGFCCVSKPQSEIEEMRKARQISGSCQRTEKLEEYEVDGDTNHSWHSLNGLQEPGKETSWNGDLKKILKSSSPQHN